MNILEYKGYHTKLECSIEDGVIYGKIEGIRDLVTFECETVSEAEAAFHEAVDDYLAFCREVGKEPEKEYKGQFNVRIEPELHKAAAVLAYKRNLSLNALVEEAIQEKVTGKTKAELHFHIEQIMPGYEFSKMGEMETMMRGVSYGAKS